MMLGQAKVATVVGVLMGAALTSTMVVRTTQAVFSGTTDSAAAWSSGGAVISNDGTGTAAFSTANDGLLKNGQSLVKCIVVSYAGKTTPANVKLYATGVSGALAPYLDITVDTGTSTSVNGNCNGWSVGTAGVFSGTLSTFGSARNSFASGVGTWAPSVIDEKLTYRFTVTVQNTPAAQNQTAAATFTWEAQTT